MFWLWGGLLFWFGLFFGCYLLGISAFFPMRRMLGYVGLLGVSMGKDVEGVKKTDGANQITIVKPFGK
jgi:hypothetical protein